MLKLQIISFVLTVRFGQQLAAMYGKRATVRITFDTPHESENAGSSAFLSVDMIRDKTKGPNCPSKLDPLVDTASLTIENDGLCTAGGDLKRKLVGIIRRLERARDKQIRRIAFDWSDLICHLGADATRPAKTGDNRPQH